MPNIHLYIFTSRESINKIDKIQERALRFVLKDHTSSYNDLLLKSGFDSFRIYALKSLMIELFKILEGMTPDYLSELFVKADNPYDTRDKCKLIQTDDYIWTTFISVLRRICLEHASYKYKSSTVIAWI